MHDERARVPAVRMAFDLSIWKYVIDEDEVYDILPNHFGN
jgi:hypothetical protein